ncbi:May24p [Rhodotorula paludigena]|uniref:May24p n=1 Tax=Rhodotorula paludigena TaxID=86838 RepID=UPI0031793A40
MSALDDAGANNIWVAPPDGYVEPSWPGLYNPLGGDAGRYLYRPEQIWRFTVYDTLVLVGTVYFFAGCLCGANFARRHPRLALLAPVVYSTVGIGLGFVGATIIGYCLAALYNAAFLRMSTWVPALYSLILTLTLVLSSTTIQNKAFMS